MNALDGDLTASAFRGDIDVEDLHAFFQPDVHFDGDTLWSFGTSLKSAYVNSFEFMNHAPVVQLWRDEAGAIQAVSRVSLGTGEWFHLAAPRYRNEGVSERLTRQADAAFTLLTDHPHWYTVCYARKVAETEWLERLGYECDEVSEVYMTRSLVDPVPDVACPDEATVRLLDLSDAQMFHERAMAQIDAFSDRTPGPSERAWIARSLPHQMSYGRPQEAVSVVAVAQDGTILAFADPFFDHRNGIGEFEPVGTRRSAQRKGFSRAVMARALQEMRAQGMTQAVVRTGSANAAAIPAYESMGFVITDELVRFRKVRGQ